MRGIRRERLCPRRLEVDRVDQHEARQRVEHALADQLGDAAVGSVADPLVDLHARTFGVRPVVHQPQAGAEALRQRVEKGLLPLLVALRERRVGHVERQVV